jgi:hypothetical protein
MKTTTLQLKHSMNHYPLALLLIPLALVCFALSPQARATCQDGCLTNNNTVLGDNALLNNTSGSQNTANGASALLNNTTGSNDTAIGFTALLSNTTGSENTAIGLGALYFNNGSWNTAIGGGALFYNTTGIENTAIGFNALVDHTTGSNNIALGFNAGAYLTTGDNNINIGNLGDPRVPGQSNTIRIGTVGTQTKTLIAGISGATVPTGVAVIIDATGHLGTTTSSARFKDAIRPMDKASEAVLSLKPVTFRYKHELDPEGVRQFGLVAEDVEKVNPDLVARDDEGKPYTVRYDGVNAMLLNEFLKEHKTVQELKKQVAELTAGLQKVSAQLEVSEAAPQTVLKNQ